jgi:hypothetical protein
MAKVTSVKRSKPDFDNVKSWYDTHLHPDANEYADKEVFENVYHEGRWPAIFQCVDENANILLADKSTKKLKDIQSGDTVISYNEEQEIFEFKNVLNNFDKGEKECIEIKFREGGNSGYVKTLVCTLDHKILTKNRGWIEAQDLTKDDDVITHHSHDRILPLESFSLDKRALTVKTLDGLEIKEHDKFLYPCVRCNKVYKAAIIFEKDKKYRWHCKGCSISREWNENEAYLQIHQETIKSALDNPVSKARLSKVSKKNWETPEIKNAMLTRDVKAAAKKGNITRVNNLLSGKTVYKVPHGKWQTHSSNGRTFRMRSTYEKRFAEVLDATQYTWDYESKVFPILEDKVYIPDFYIDGLGYVEVKGWWREDAKQKFDAFVAAKLAPIAIVEEKELIALESKEISIESLFN